MLKRAFHYFFRDRDATSAAPPCSGGHRRPTNAEDPPPLQGEPIIRTIKERTPPKIRVQEEEVKWKDRIIRIIKECAPPLGLIRAHSVTKEDEGRANPNVGVDDKDSNFETTTERRRSSSAEYLERVIAESIRCQNLIDLIHLHGVECLAEDAGESSNPAQTEREAHCGICMEDKFSFECFPMKGCSHTYCAACISQYVTAKVEENVTSIGCPHPTCKDGVLELEMCRLILPRTVFDRWGSTLCETTLGQRKLYCPYGDCSAVLVDEGDDKGKPIVDTVCPHCLRWFCAQCKAPWHNGVTCKEFRKLGADERGKEDLMLRQMAKKYKWQRCPNCRIYVERIKGCAFVRCRCGFQFCYGCARAMDANNHFCFHCWIRIF